MKKLLYAVAGLAILCGLTTSSFAASGTTNLTFNITIHVSAYDIDLTADAAILPPNNIVWGTVRANGTTFSNLASGNPRITLEQAGYETIRLGVHATAANWTNVASGTPGTLGLADNTFRLAGVFTSPLTVADAPSNTLYAHTLSIADFTAGCVVPTIAGTFADSTHFTRPGEIAATGTQFLGYGVSPDVPIRSLRFAIDTATNYAVTDDTITVVITGAI